MSKFTLPIKSTYVSSWGLWECLREMVQNAKDEEDQNGHAMAVEWKPTAAMPGPAVGQVWRNGSVTIEILEVTDTHVISGYTRTSLRQWESWVNGDAVGQPKLDGFDRPGLLTLRNEGADMDRKALLIGHSGKAGSDLRGKHGEGLNLALLAGVRLGRKILIETKTERWTPTIGYAEEFGANCLSIATRARKSAGPGVAVTIEVTEGEWAKYRDRFIFLSNIPDNRVVRIPDQGSILLEESRKGCVYVRGIYVDTLPKLEAGYDLTQMTLDRDRRMIDVWDLQWRLGQMYQDAMARRPELLGGRVYKMLRDGSEDTKGFHYHATKEAAAALAIEFRTEHGDDAVPVASIAEARELEHLGRRGVVVQDALRDSLKKEMGDISEIKTKLKNEVVRSVPWADLAFEHKAIFTQYTTLIDSLGAIPTPVAQRIDIVEFRDPRIEGLWQGDNGRISIALRMLDDPRGLLKVLVHEVAHAVSEAGDGHHGHTESIEDLWAKLYFRRTAS